MTYITVRYDFDVLDSDLLHAKARIIDPEMYEELEDIDDATAFSVLLDKIPTDRINESTHGVKLTTVSNLDFGV